MKKIIILIMLMALLPNVMSVDYSKTTGDSLFVVGVDWQKNADTPTDYMAYVTVDLNYNLFSNPLNRYAVVEQYFWNNWWSDYTQFGSAGIVTAGIDTSDGYYEWERLDFFYELPDIKPGSEADDYQCNVQGYCGEILPTQRAGYYGLPFYIQYLEFVCDIDSNNKGGITIIPDDSDTDIFALNRPNYDGIPNSEVTVETATAPLGFGTRPGEVVRYNGIPVECSNMDTTDNARLSFVLKPNPLYRHVNPEIAGSEEWTYGSIISLLPSVLNSNNLPFNLNIDFNFSGDFWDYELDTATELEAFEDAYYWSNDFDLICEVERFFGGIEHLTFKELTTEQKLQVNTGEGITCMYPPDQTIIDLNNKGINNVIDAISFQKQKEIVLQFDLLEKKLITKKFVAHTIIPFFVMILIFIFYIVQLIMLAFVFIGIIPLMFNQFIKGLKDAFSIEYLLTKTKKRRGFRRK